MKIYNCSNKQNYEKPRVYFNFTGVGWEPKRFLKLTYESKRYIFGDGWKVTVCVQPRVFFWDKQTGDLRFALLGLGVHLRSKK